MANTTNLNLVKPAGTDYALVSVINGNMDIIDSKVGAVPSNASVQGQIDTLNNQITALNGFESRTVAWINASTNLNDCTDPTKVYAWGNVYPTNTPTTNCRMFYYPGDAPVQVIISNNGSNIFIRINIGYWSDWYSSNGTDISSHVTATTGNTILSAKRYGGMIVIMGTTAKITTANASQSIATVDTGYRPVANAGGSITASATSDFGYGALTLTTAGALSVTYSKATSYGLIFTITYSV